MENPNLEAGKDVSRLAIFGAISTIATYFLNLLFPNLPGEVQAAFLVLLLAGLTYADSFIHNSVGKLKNVNGLLPW